MAVSYSQCPYVIALNSEDPTWPTTWQGKIYVQTHSTRNQNQRETSGFSKHLHGLVITQWEAKVPDTEELSWLALDFTQEWARGHKHEPKAQESFASFSCQKNNIQIMLHWFGVLLLEIPPFSVHGRWKQLKSTPNAINPRVMLATFIITDIR